MKLEWKIDLKTKELTVRDKSDWKFKDFQNQDNKVRCFYLNRETVLYLKELSPQDYLLTLKKTSKISGKIKKAYQNITWKTGTNSIFFLDFSHREHKDGLERDISEIFNE